MSDPVGLTMAGKIDVLLILGKGQNMWNGQKHIFSSYGSRVRITRPRSLPLPAETEQEEIKEIFMLFTVDKDLH